MSYHLHANDGGLIYYYRSSCRVYLSHPQWALGQAIVDSDRCCPRTTVQVLPAN